MLRPNARPAAIKRVSDVGSEPLHRRVGLGRLFRAARGTVAATAATGTPTAALVARAVRYQVVLGRNAVFVEHSDETSQRYFRTNAIGLRQYSLVRPVDGRRYKVQARLNIQLLDIVCFFSRRLSRDCDTVDVKFRYVFRFLISKLVDNLHVRLNKFIHIEFSSYQYLQFSFRQFFFLI